MEFLLQELNGTSRNHVKDLLHGRGVMVDRKVTTRFDAPLCPGQMVLVSRSKRSTELNNRFVKIVYEDKDIIVIEKAEGILSMASAAGQFCVKEILDDYFQRRHFRCTAHVVHRLDRETSGLMVYAKNMQAEQILERNWHQIVYDRRYVAVVCGRVEQPGGTIHSWLKDNKSFVTYSSPTDNGGKEAITHFRTLATTDDLSLLELRLDTGRKNQIRVHMQDIGYPVAGDTKYGNGRNPLGRLALHAFRLYLYHPITGQPLQFETPLPYSFTRFFNNDEAKDKKGESPQE